MKLSTKLQFAQNTLIEVIESLRLEIDSLDAQGKTEEAGNLSYLMMSVENAKEGLGTAVRRLMQHESSLR